MRHGEGILSGTCSGLHGRYPVGTPRDTSKRYVTFPPPLHRKSTRNIRVIETRERERDFIAKNVVPSQKQRRGGALRPKAQRRVSSWRIVPRIENAGFHFVVIISSLPREKVCSSDIRVGYRRRGSIFIRDWRGMGGRSRLLRKNRFSYIHGGRGGRPIVRWTRIQIELP